MTTTDNSIDFGFLLPLCVVGFINDDVNLNHIKDDQDMPLVLIVVVILFLFMNDLLTILDVVKRCCFDHKLFE
jgi:hypothetical protein